MSTRDTPVDTTRGTTDDTAAAVFSSVDELAAAVKRIRPFPTFSEISNDVLKALRAEIGGAR